jgi:hypothetical protein
VVAVSLANKVAQQYVSQSERVAAAVWSCRGVTSQERSGESYPHCTRPGDG